MRILLLGFALLYPAYMLSLSRAKDLAHDPVVGMWKGREELLETYYLSHGLMIPDALIATTALELDCSWLSKNQKDFRFIKYLTLVPYP